MARDTRETSLVAARALFSKRPEPAPVPSREQDALFEYLPETADWIPPGHMLVVTGKKLDREDVVVIRECLEDHQCEGSRELPRHNRGKVQIVQMSELVDEPAQAPTTVFGVDWGTDPAALTVTTWSCPTKQWRMGDEYPDGARLSEKQMKEQTLKKLGTKLKRQFDTGEIVGHGDPAIEIDRDTFQRRHRTLATVKVALPPNGVDFSIIGGSDSMEAVRDATSRILREQPGIQTVEILPPQMLQAPNRNVIADDVEKILTMVNQRIISRQKAQESLPIGMDLDALEATRRSFGPTANDFADFATQLQQDPGPPVHPHCRTDSTIVDADREPQPHECWTDGSEVVRIVAVGGEVNENLIRLKHRESHIEYEKTMSLDHFKRKWWLLCGNGDPSAD